MKNSLKKFLLTPFSIMYKFAPVLEQRIVFRIKCGYKLNLDNPKTYNEKLAWLKLYDRNALVPKLVDKYTVREYIKKTGYVKHLPTMYWNGFNAKEIPWGDLPDNVVNNNFYIGELTFLNSTGYDGVSSQEFNLKMGQWIQL